MRTVVSVLFVSISVLSTESFGQNWTLMGPTGGQYEDNDLITGNGTGPAEGSAYVYWKKLDDPDADPDDPNNWTLWGTDTVQTIDFMGTRMWSDTFDPERWGNDNELWDLSNFKNGMPYPDYQYSIKGQGDNNSGAESAGIKVVAH
jgi:hypothetical protein